MSQGRERSTEGRPQVSVVIITRNRPAMLADCLAHVGQQSYIKYEIVVVDSSLSDETAAVVEDWTHATYVRIRGGRNNMPAARNAGIAQARGDVIAFIDDDSMVSPP